MCEILIEAISFKPLVNFMVTIISIKQTKPQILQLTERKGVILIIFQPPNLRIPDGITEKYNNVKQVLTEVVSSAVNLSVQRVNTTTGTTTVQR